LIADQIRYYSERAAEYDETTTPPVKDSLESEELQLETALAGFEPRGKVLEIASGTGKWTRLLARSSSEVTALDASWEMLELSRAKLAHYAHIRYVQADIFNWEPHDRFDVVFFANWLSHVPPSRFDRFWETVRSCLLPSGRVFFLDEETQDEWRREDFLDEMHTLVRRRLRDGRAFEIVKVFYETADLEARLQRLGWRIEVHRAGNMCWGAGLSPEA
jgi:SAM-dependent methyltransferase